jgi:hypothetical protein
MKKLASKTMCAAALLTGSSSSLAHGSGTDIVHYLISADHLLLVALVAVAGSALLLSAGQWIRARNQR